jgi:uncharacterized Zn finger protein
MKWRFSCHRCPEMWEVEHRVLKESDFIYSPKKTGRPTLNCYTCDRHGKVTPIIGDMVGNRG